MLVLTRKTDERIAIGDGVELVVLSIRGNRVRLGITAPADTSITRPPTAVIPLENRRREAVCRPR